MSVKLLEMLDQMACVAFGEFLNIKNINLIRSNTAKNHAYYHAYKNFINHASLPAVYLERAYTSKYAHHFYSREETRFFHEKWHKLKNHFLIDYA